MRKAIVYGNGESRIGHYLYGEFPNDEYVTWVCNAIYRDIDVMNLVSVDYGMQLEIYDSGYAHAHKCWFGDWNIIPAYFDGDENILVDKLIEENNISVDNDTLKKEIEDKSKSFKDPEQYVNWIYGNEEQLKNIESLVLEDKVAEYLEEKSKVEEETLSFEEVVSMG